MESSGIKVSLRQKLIRVTMLTLGLVGLGMISVITWMQQQSTDRQLAVTEQFIKSGLDSRGQSLTENHALALEGFIEDYALGSVEDLVSRTVAEDDDIVYGIFVDEEGKAWSFAHPKNPAGKVRKDDDWQAFLSLNTEGLMSKERFRKVLVFGQDIYEYSSLVLIEEEFAGSVRYGYSINNLKQALADARSEANREFIKKLTMLILVCAIAVIFGWVRTRRQAAHITKPLAELSSAADRLAGGDRGVTVNITSGDEIEALGSSFNSMARDLKASYENLEQKVADRTVDLKRKTDDINNMLQNMKQGIFTITEGQLIHHEYSKHLELLLGTDDIAGKRMMDAVFSNTNLGVDVLDRVDVAVDNALGEYEMNFHLNGHLFVKEFERLQEDGENRILEADWNPIVNDADDVEKIMVTLRDVTELRQLELEMGAQRRRLQIIGQILAVSRASFESFAKSSSEFVLANRAIIGDGATPSSELVTELFRNVHTIKGNARTYDFTFLNDRVHIAETTYSDMRDAIPDVWPAEQLLAELDEIEAGVSEYMDVYQTDLNVAEGDDGMGGAGAELVERLVDALSGDDAIEAVTKAREILLESTSQTLDSVLRDLARSARSIAEELDKPTPRIVLNTSGLKVPGDRVGLIKNVFTHIFRNSVDHGLEPSDERLRVGKDPEGTIVLDAKEVNGAISITVQDDGRGLNLAKLSEKAVKEGLDPTTLSDADIANFIFRSGVSTAASVTDISGRGVGMDAVRSFLEADGGGIQIELMGRRNESGYCSFKFNCNIPI